MMQELGLPADHVPVEFLDGATRVRDELQHGSIPSERDRAIIGQAFLKRELGGRYEDLYREATPHERLARWAALREGVAGFATTGKAPSASPSFDKTVGKAFLSSHCTGYHLGYHIHEVIHALSHRFLRESHAADLPGYRELREGLTEYFAEQVARWRFGIQPNRAHGYHPYLEFARALASRVGYRRLRALFFGTQAGVLEMLHKVVDGPKPGRLYLACRELALVESRRTAGDADGARRTLKRAIKALGPQPMGDGTFRRTPWHSVERQQ
jgi:hypothetical protein